MGTPDGKSLTVLLTLLTYFTFVSLSLATSNPVQPHTPKPLPTETLSTEVSNQPSIEDVQRFSSTFNQIKTFYVDDVSDKKLFENAMRGMLSGLDPHSTYLDEQEFRDLQISTSGEYAGLGLEIMMEDGYLKVISPLDDGPAEKAGVMSGDVIIKINQKMVKGLTLREAVELMRGKPQEKVKITLLRKGAKRNPLTFTMTREKIEIKTVKSQLLTDHYGYLCISHFQGHSTDDMKKQIQTMQKQSNGTLKGLILDLRNNPGGLLDAAIRISDTFIEAQSGKAQPLIVSTKGRASGSESSARATPGDLINGAPMVVLINQGSASASEIVAGALQDNKRALIMGTRSFGKGSVQTILPLDEKHGVKITTARYYTPSGRTIQATGIEPDITVESLAIDPNKKEHNDNEIVLSEADLQGHLKNTINHKSENKNEKNAIAPSENLAGKNKKTSLSESLAKDYQVQEALHLLKGLSVYQKTQMRNTAQTPKDTNKNTSPQDIQS